MISSTSEKYFSAGERTRPDAAGSGCCADEGSGGFGFWAAGYWGRSATLLIVWVGVIALTRGITEIIFAFKLRSVGKAAAA